MHRNLEIVKWLYNLSIELNSPIDLNNNCSLAKEIFNSFLSYEINKDIIFWLYDTFSIFDICVQNGKIMKFELLSYKIFPKKYNLYENNDIIFI